MASHKALAISLLLTLNLLLFTMAQLPSPPPPPSSQGNCPMNALQLGVCESLLSSVNATVGRPPSTPCCSLIAGLFDHAAAVCLCTALKAGILGININIPVSLSVILNDCGRNSTGYQCN